MKQDSIIAVTPDTFEKCGNIWDIRQEHIFVNYCLDTLKKGERATFAFLHENAFIGEISLVFDRNDSTLTVPGKRIYLSRLLVKKEFRHNGVGTALLLHACEYAKGLCYSEASLGVNLQNFAALRLYWKCGFTSIVSVDEDPFGPYLILLKLL